MAAFFPVRPKDSAQATRTAGAICTTVVISGSARASSTFTVSSRAVRAPVGQWVTHWPQKVQSEVFRVRLPETSTVVREPVPARSQIPMVWTFSQIWTQRIHLMHLLACRTSGVEVSV